jgi:hypothetical protein
MSGMISTSLRTGTPLPQITPCPLVDRFLAQDYGFSVVRQGVEDDFGLPRTMTIEILENEQYMFAPALFHPPFFLLIPIF